MKAQLAAVFSESESPSYISKRDIHDGMTPIMEIASKVQSQISIYRQLLIAADLSDHDHSVDGKLEQVYQTLGALDSSVVSFLKIGRQLAKAATQLDRVMADAQKTILQLEKESTQIPQPTPIPNI